MMRDRRLAQGLTLLTICAGLCVGWAARAQASPAGSGPAPAPAPESVAGWTDLIDGLRDLPDRILARLPADKRLDPQLRQEVGRLALSAVAGAMLDALASDPDHPVFIPQLNDYITTGQANADTGYRTAKIAPGGIYRLRGRRGLATMARIAEAGPRPKQVEGGPINLGGPRPVHDLNALHVDSQGRYDVILSPERPKGYVGDWWQLDPTTNLLLVRMVKADWERESEPTLSIDRLDVSAARGRVPRSTLEANLRGIAPAAAFIGPLLVADAEKLRAAGVINALRMSDFSRQGGLAGQYYYEGAYDLKDDEALLIETKLPERCGYRSLILTNGIYETTDWYNNHSSLNGAQAAADRDGILRIVVSARDPGVPNWLSTAGYATGVIQGRWADCSTRPVPVIRKMPLSQVRRSLPAETPVVTPAERDRIVRDRRAALQQHPLW